MDVYEGLKLFHLITLTHVRKKDTIIVTFSIKFKYYNQIWHVIKTLRTTVFLFWAVSSSSWRLSSYLLCTRLSSSHPCVSRRPANLLKSGGQSVLPCGDAVVAVYNFRWHEPEHYHVLPHILFHSRLLGAAAVVFPQCFISVLLYFRCCCCFFPHPVFPLSCLTCVALFSFPTYTTLSSSSDLLPPLISASLSLCLCLTE